jgi:hypothetical protein
MISRPLLAPASPLRAETAFVEADPRWRKAQEKSEKASEARRALPPGSSRARVTSANARWRRAAVARDRIERELRDRFRALRQPWQMSRAEWLREINATRMDWTGGHGVPGGQRIPIAHHMRNLARRAFLRSYLPDRCRDDLQAPPDHCDVVAQAIAEGFDVPAEVRAEYAEAA